MTHLHYRVRKCAIFNIAALLGDDPGDRSAAQRLHLESTALKG